MDNDVKSEWSSRLLTKGGSLLDQTPGGVG